MPEPYHPDRKPVKIKLDNSQATGLLWLMVKTPSTMVPLGTAMPSFTLPEPASGRNFASSDIPADHAVAVLFICNHCPYVKHIANELARFGRDYHEKPLTIVAISSNDAVNYPEDSPELMVKEAEHRNYTFPYLFDESQAVAREFRATCTPDIFLYDSSRKLVYRGQFDDSRPSNDLPVTGADLRKAVDQLLAGEPISDEQKPAIGCSIKWRPM